MKFKKMAWIISFVCLFNGFLILPAETAAAEKEKITGLKLVSSVNFPHGWAVDFVKIGKYIYQTKSESDFKLAAIDVSQPDKMKVIAEIEAGDCAARNICAHNNIILCNSYQYILPIDISNPQKPKELKEYIWQPDEKDGGTVRPFYRFECRDDYLFLACDSLKKALRVYKVGKPFKPELAGVLDLSGHETAENKELLQKTWYPNSEMIIAGNKLFVSYGSLLAGFDITKPDAPRLIFANKMKESIESITVSGDTIYICMSGRKGEKLAPGTEKIIALDIGNPADIHQIGSFTDLELPERILVAGDRLFVAGLEKVPLNEQAINGIPFTAGIASSYEYRPVFYILALQSPGKFKLLARTALPCRNMAYFDSACRRMVYENGLLYAADHTFGIRVFDVKNDALKELGSIRTITSETYGMVFTKDYLYISGASCMLPVNIADITKPSIDRDSITFLPGGSSTYIPPKPGRYIYNTSVRYKELIVTDIQNPGKPCIANLIPLPADALWYILHQTGDYIYVVGNGTNKNNPVCIFKTEENGKNLKLIGRLNLAVDAGPGEEITGSIQRGLCAEQGRLYIVAYMPQRIKSPPKTEEKGRTEEKGKTAIFTLDISKPEEPKILGAFATDEIIPLGTLSYGGPGVYKKKLFLFSHWVTENNAKFSWFCAFDMNNPEKPVLILKTKLEDPSLIKYSYSGTLLVLDPYPYLLFQEYTTGLRLVDISNPAAPKIVWREEPRPTDHKFQNYSTYGWGKMVFKDGCIFVPRLDHLDVFKPEFSAE